MNNQERDPNDPATRAGMLAQTGLRLVMLASYDPVARAIAQEFLGETPAQAFDVLNDTCWKVDLRRAGQLRETCINFYTKQEKR
ncbi:MAG: hypothetical protein K8L99_24325 [Anaerolineae bacterium]|nr:hypothetical protein [Anaerolineae bacterium]